jgi:hypothetical protein
LKNLLDEIDWHQWHLFPHNNVELLSTKSPNGFRNWAEENQFDLGPGRHPLENAHMSAHNILQDKFNELVIQINKKN